MKFFLNILIFFTLIQIEIKANDIVFPPELIWWINEAKKINENIQINSFQYYDLKIINYSNNRVSGRMLRYPVFMRWNYSGNYVAYYDFNLIGLNRLESGKYCIGEASDISNLYISDRRGNTFLIESFGLQTGLDSIQWITDTVLVGVGMNIDEYIDLLIFIYKFNYNERIIEKKSYIFKNAFDSIKRNNLNFFWFEQRPDYFEIQSER